MLGFDVVYDPEVSMGEFEAYSGGSEGYDKPDSQQRHHTYGGKVVRKIFEGSSWGRKQRVSRDCRCVWMNLGAF
jgi:hypothetical protein